jgi:hypothetical protein
MEADVGRENGLWESRWSRLPEPHGSAPCQQPRQSHRPGTPTLHNRNTGRLSHKLGIASLPYVPPYSSPCCVVTAAPPIGSDPLGPIAIDSQQQAAQKSVPDGAQHLQRRYNPRCLLRNVAHRRLSVKVIRAGWCVHLRVGLMEFICVRLDRRLHWRRTPFVRQLTSLIPLSQTGQEGALKGNPRQSSLHG